jgi:hypothetical protein
MIDGADRERVVKLLGMLTSDFDGERANASALISKLASKYKVTIPQLCALATGAPDRDDRTPHLRARLRRDPNPHMRGRDPVPRPRTRPNKGRGPKA